MGELIGRGNTAEVFDLGDGKVCKLFFKGYPNEYVKLEFNNAAEMRKKQVKVPVAFRIARETDRIGIVYEKIYGRSLSDIIYNGEQPLECSLSKIVNFQLSIVKKRSLNVPSYKDYLSAILKNGKMSDSRIFELIDNLPVGDHLLHGDLHPGNILITPDGQPVAIDFMNVCHGPVLYDIARTYFIIRQRNAFLASEYLKKIGVSRNSLENYIKIIELCRKFE